MDGEALGAESAPAVGGGAGLRHERAYEALESAPADSPELDGGAEVVVAAG